MPPLALDACLECQAQLPSNGSLLDTSALREEEAHQFSLRPPTLGSENPSPESPINYQNTAIDGSQLVSRLLCFSMMPTEDIPQA